MFLARAGFPRVVLDRRALPSFVGHGQELSIRLLGLLGCRTLLRGRVLGRRTLLRGMLGWRLLRRRGLFGRDQSFFGFVGRRF